MILTLADHFLVQDIQKIFSEGYKDINPRPKYPDGSPAHTFSVNHVTRSYDLSKGEFPVCTLRPIAWKSAIKEILWIYQDATNDLSTLNDKYNVHYWNEWESKEYPGTIGKGRYGDVVNEYNLIENLLSGLKDNPYGRRHIMDLYQYKGLEESDGLYPCAFLTIWNVRNDNNGTEYLDMSLIQRSGDMIAASGAGGINEIQYAALLMMVAKHVGYEPGVFTHFVANEQIYDRHLNAATELRTRYKVIDKDFTHHNHYKENEMPYLKFNPKHATFYNFTIEDFEMVNYEPIHPQLHLDLGI